MQTQKTWRERLAIAWPLEGDSMDRLRGIIETFIETTIAEERGSTKQWILDNIEDNETKDKIVSYLSNREA